MLIKSFGENLKCYNIEFYNKNINKYFDENNEYHKTFINYGTRLNENLKHSLLAQFYKINKCFNIMENYEINNNFKYDIIIRSRFDTYLTNVMNDKINIEKLNYKNIVYTSSNGPARHINDWWMIGNRNIMKIYCNYYNVFSPNLFKKDKYHYLYNDNGVFIYSEYDSNKKLLDISDSSEVGLQYLIDKNNYIVDDKTICFCQLKHYM